MDSDFEKLKEESQKIEINYFDMSGSLLKILNTNGCHQIKRLKLYFNAFLYGKKYSFENKPLSFVPIFDIPEYNSYYTIFDSFCKRLNNEGLELYEESKYNIKNLIKKTVNIEEVLEANNNIEKNIEKTSKLGELYNYLKKEKQNKHLDCERFADVLKYSLEYTTPVKLALYVKIIAKFLNPKIEDSKLTNEKLPFLSILDLIDSEIIYENKKYNVKNLMLNLVKIELIKKLKEEYGHTQYYKNNIEIIKIIQSKILELKKKLELLLEIGLGIENKSVNGINIYEILIQTLFGPYKFSDFIITIPDILLLCIGETRFKNYDKVLAEYKNFPYDLVYSKKEKDFDLSKLDYLKRFINPIFFTYKNYSSESESKAYDQFFKKISKDLFPSILNTTSLDYRKDLIMELFGINKSNLNLKENIQIFRKDVKINTKDKWNTKENLFHSTELNSKCPKIRDNYESTLNISKQFYNNAINITSYAPYFASYPIKWDDDPIESGFTTGPTKQIMYNLSNLLNYVIRFDTKSDKIEFITPIWVNDELKFYTFLTHYLLIDLNLEISKINFYFNFKMLMPLIINMYGGDNMIEDTDKLSIYFEKSRFSDIIKEFNRLVKIKDINSLFFDGEKPKYDNINKKNYKMFYNKICLFLIADLIDGGNQYTYLKNEESRNFLFGADFLETILEVNKMPDGFLDLHSFKLFYLNSSESELYQLIEDKLLKIYFIINDNKTFNSEDIIKKIIFINESDDNKYDVLNNYLKRIITDYSEGLPDDLVKTIKDKYPTQESFNEKILLAWTASINLTDSTELKFIVTSEVGQLIRINTCFNTIYYPSPREDESNKEISYEDFANIFLQSINDVGFGIGGRKKTKKRKGKAYLKNNFKKKSKKSKKSKKLILKNLLERKNKKNNKFNKKTKAKKLISKYKNNTKKNKRKQTK